MVIVGTHSTSVEKRHLPRWEVNNRVTYLLENEGEAQETRSMNLSCSGLCLTTSEPVSLQRKMRVKIYLSESTIVLAAGRVVWSQSQEGRHMAGISFSEISAKAQEMILEHAFELKKEDVVKHWFQGWDK
jgi:c-di-GMP-binding flagellar brake protein YcgR